MTEQYSNDCISLLVQLSLVLHVKQNGSDMLICASAFACKFACLGIYVGMFLFAVVLSVTLDFVSSC